jgi:hypothetical protein
MASISHGAVASRPSAWTGRGGLLDQYFYFVLSLLVAAIVVWGFSHSVDQNLFHAALPRPFLLWVHGAAFSGWVVFYILQSTLVRTRNVKLHRSLGWFGAGLGAFMVALGFSTAVVMTRFDVHRLHQQGMEGFLIIPFYDMVAFGVCLGLAIYWRKKPELHRRLLLIATCGLLDAAFGRISYIFDNNLYFACLDGVILLGLLRDLLVNGRIHRVYRIALPLLIVVQGLVVYIWHTGPAWWLAIAHRIVG